MKTQPVYNVPGLRAGIEIMTALCEAAGGLGIAELADRTGLNGHMVFRCIRTLMDKGWVTESGAGPKYSLTLLPFHFLSKPLSRIDLVAAAEEPLTRLREETGECVYLGVWQNERVMFLLHRNGTRDIQLGGRVGEYYFPHASAPGKVILANSGQTAIGHYLQGGLKRLTPRTHTDAKTFLAEMKRVQKQGYAVDDQEYTTGGLCYAAPVRDHTGRVVGAIGTTVLVIHYSLKEVIKRLGPAILRTAERISIILGGHAPQGETTLPR